MEYIDDDKVEQKKNLYVVSIHVNGIYFILFSGKICSFVRLKVIQIFEWHTSI
jgi:hypothetical protein